MAPRPAVLLLLLASCSVARSGPPTAAVCAQDGRDDFGAASCAAGGPALAEPPVLLQRGGAARSWSLSLAGGENVYERVAGVGKWGGWCTCPDGQRYKVGDRNDGCKAGRASLACIGGEPGECEREEDEERAGMQVTCAGEQVVGSPWRQPSQQRSVAPSGNTYERVGGVGAWGGWCTCPDGQRYNVGDRNDGCRNGPASLACVGGTPGECERREDSARAGMQATCAGRSPAPTPAPPQGSGTCAPPATWPSKKNGVTCGPCAALVMTAPYGGRCDKYCESIGHVCTAAAEEVNDNCEVLESKACQDVISGTSDMLCTCQQPSGPSPPPAAPAPPPSPPADVACTSRQTWPDIKDGVTCEACTALVLTAPYGGRCDAYCESFGHECVSAAEEVSNNCDVLYEGACGVPIAGTSDMLCTCRQRRSPEEPQPAPSPPPAPTPPEPVACASRRSWPDVKDGVTCEACTALVLTEKYGGRCDRYCESFGHTCVAAAEEVSNNCDVLYRASCGQPITGTSDMLCTCRGDPNAIIKTTPTPPSPPPSGGDGWRSSGETTGSGWCEAKLPAADWSLKRSCGSQVQLSVLSYNLFWWNLFGKRGGNGRSAGKLIEGGGPFDVMGFQECDSVSRILSDARLQDSHAGLQGPRALAIAYDRGSWELLEQGKDDVAEDRSEQYYGKRSVQWVRLRHRASGKTMFFMNHHGPLPVNTGGVCGRAATASRMLRIVGENSRSGDFRVLVGDFNADTGSKLQQTLERHMYRVMDDWVDAIFASCRAESTRNLGNGGSDHDAIKASFRI